MWRYFLVGALCAAAGAAGMFYYLLHLTPQSILYNECRFSLILDDGDPEKWEQRIGGGDGAAAIELCRLIVK